VASGIYMCRVEFKGLGRVMRIVLVR
jgi:hypothetical protein